MRFDETGIKCTKIPSVSLTRTQHTARSFFHILYFAVCYDRGRLVKLLSIGCIVLLNVLLEIFVDHRINQYMYQMRLL